MQRKYSMVYTCDLLSTKKLYTGKILTDCTYLKTKYFLFVCTRDLSNKKNSFTWYNFLLILLFSDRMKSPWEKPIIINLVYWLNKIIVNVTKLLKTITKVNDWKYCCIRWSFSLEDWLSSGRLVTVRWGPPVSNRPKTLGCWDRPPLLTSVDWRKIAHAL